MTPTSSKREYSIHYQITVFLWCHYIVYIFIFPAVFALQISFHIFPSDWLADTCSFSSNPFWQYFHIALSSKIFWAMSIVSIENMSLFWILSLHSVLSLLSRFTCLLLQVSLNSSSLPSSSEISKNLEPFLRYSRSHSSWSQNKRRSNMLTLLFY